MAKKAETTLTTVDTTIPDAMAIVEKKISSMEIIQQTPFKTNKTLDGFGTLTSITEVDKLISAYASIIVREEAYLKAASALRADNQPYPPFKVNGYTAEDWKHDIKLQLAIVEQDQTLKQLQAFKSELSQFLSEDDKKKQLYDKIQNFFGTKA